MPKKYIAAIPARLNSSRLPNKVIADIAGVPMIIRVLKRCEEAIDKKYIVLCTDSDLLCSLAKENGYKYIKTSSKCNSGTERIASVYNELLKIAWDIGPDNTKNIEVDHEDTLIINIQGDQPFLSSDTLRNLLSLFTNEKKRSFDIITPIYKLKKENIHNPAVVKTLINSKGDAIYFSRSALPHIRDIDQTEWYKYNCFWGHVGMYGYKGDVIKKWFSLPESKLEKLEKLEQLKFIDSGFTINTFKVEGDSLSVDTQKQLDEAVRMAYNE